MLILFHRMSRIAVLLLIPICGVVAQTYTMMPGKNAYRNDHSFYGAEHLDHCERAGNTLAQCQEWCTNDCECHCVVVYKANGACFRRHSCNGPFQENNDWDLYIKDGHTSTCSKFDDQGFDTKCVANSPQTKNVINVGSLEECKNVCSLLSFECKGIEYFSNCDDPASDTCKIFTSTIDNGEVVAPDLAQKRHYQCLKYTGSVGSSDSLSLGMSMTIAGVDGAALIQDQTAANALEQSVQESVANQSPLVDSQDVTVNLRAGSLIVDIQVMMASATNFLDTRQTLKDNEAALTSDIVSRINNLPSLAPFRGGTIEVTTSAFNMTQPLPTETVTTTMTQINTTTETIPVTSRSHQICVLSITPVWLTAYLVWASIY